MELRDFKQLYQPLIDTKMSDEFREHMVRSLEEIAISDLPTHRDTRLVNRLSTKTIAIIAAILVIFCPIVGFAVVKLVGPVVIGKPVIQHVQETAPTQADIEQAVKVVEELNQAVNAGNWNVVQSLVYNTSPVPMPKNWFETQAKHYPPGAAHAPNPQKFIIGTPYIVKDWTTTSTNAVSNASSNVSHAYSKAFQYAITVPVYYGNDRENPVLFHCVKVNGRWLVAYNWLSGYDRQDHRGDPTITTLPFKVTK